MKLIKTGIKNIRRIKKEVYLLSFVSTYLARNTLPGQFLHIKISPSTLLRRPFSVHTIKRNDIYILFRVRGEGTHLLSHYKKGDRLDIIGPLGNGFNCKQQITTNKQQILIAGGMGVAPLVFLGEKLGKIQNKESKIQNIALLGAKTKIEVLCDRDFKKMGYKVLVATEDGSRGHRGTATDLLKKILNAQRPARNTDIYACGPKEMLLEMSKILRKYPKATCQVSFEQFMGCGVGVCYGCVIETIYGYKRVCREGPVFDLKDIK